MTPRRRVLALVTLVLAVAACGLRPVRYHYHDAQLGRRTWEVRASDVYPSTKVDLDRFVLYRAAELTRGFGYRYFAVRSYTGDPAEYRAFTVKALATRAAAASAFPAVTDESEREAARARSRDSKTAVVREVKERLTFRLLEPDDIGDGSDAVDAEVVLEHLAPFIARRRQP
jgi:hypothetical protein